jgi:hypothetical protein
MKDTERIDYRKGAKDTELEPGFLIVLVLDQKSTLIH